MRSKPINLLTPTDIEQHPIWEFAIDEEGIEGQDETSVRPFDSVVVPLNEYSLSVAADFSTSNESKFSGIVDVSTAGEITLGHAALLLPGSYLFVPRKGFDKADETYKAIAAALGQPVDSFFPLRATLRVLIESEDSFRKSEFG